MVIPIKQILEMKGTWYGWTPEWDFSPVNRQSWVPAELPKLGPDLLKNTAGRDRAVLALSGRDSFPRPSVGMDTPPRSGGRPGVLLVELHPNGRSPETGKGGFTFYWRPWWGRHFLWSGWYPGSSSLGLTPWWAFQGGCLLPLHLESCTNSLLSLKEIIAKTRPKNPSKRTKQNLDIAPSCPFGE